MGWFLPPSPAADAAPATSDNSIMSDTVRMDVLPPCHFPPVCVPANAWTAEFPPTVSCRAVHRSPYKGIPYTTVSNTDRSLKSH
ncbi:MAG: hypothetical protein OHK0028_14680 [Deltaproteobacteria bacterium]